MKKIIFIFIFTTFLFADNYKMYEDYVNRIVNYSLELKKPIYDPFLKPVFKYINPSSYALIYISKKNNKHKHKETKFRIISILIANSFNDGKWINNNKVWLEYKIGNEIIKQWLKEGQVINGYKIIKIEKGDVLLKHNNKIEKLVFHKKNNRKLRIRIVK